METIDARGQACPLPVVRAKRALSRWGRARSKCSWTTRRRCATSKALAKTLKCACSSERRGEAQFAVRIEKGAADGVEAAEGTAAGAQAADAACDCEAARGDQVVVVSSERMGTGDDELGRTLMKGFLFALTQLDELPGAVLLYNGGVKWACEGSEALDDLRALRGTAGTEVLSCGTCLAHYGLTERLAVGEPTNMYAIVERQMGAGVVVRP